MTPGPWICPRCDLVIAPSVLEHRCKPDDGGSAVPAVTPVRPAGGGTAITATFGGGVGYTPLTGEVFRAIAGGGSGGTVTGTVWEGVTITARNAA